MLTTLLAGALMLSAPTLNVRVDGEGYLRFMRDGRAVYAKSAELVVTGGKLGCASGAALLPTITVPADVQSLDVDLEGNVSAVLSQGKFPVGRIVLALFPVGTQLLPERGFLISQDRPSLGNPGDGTNGVIRADGKAVTPAPEIKQLDHSAGGTKPSKAGPVIETTNDGSVRIEVASSSEIDGATITLGDIAKIHAGRKLAAQLATVDLGNTPPVGVRVPLGALRIVSRLRASGFDPSNYALDIPAGATVARKATHVTQQQFVDCAIAYAKTQVAANSEFSCRETGPDYLAPLGKLELKVEQYTATMNGATLTVAVYVDGQRQNARNVRVELTGVNGGPAVRVPAGTRVKIALRSSGAIVEVQGKTMKAAFVGQEVAVQTDAKTNHTGTLTASDTVEVKL